jgi:3-oxoacyl-[acyl-carrier protein] reductase
MGLAIAEALAEEGANVAIARRREPLEREADRLGALAVRGDVTNAADLRRLVERTVDAFGGIDVLVNNSGGPPRTTAVELTDDLVEEAVELLLLSVVRLTRGSVMAYSWSLGVTRTTPRSGSVTGRRDCVS